MFCRTSMHLLGLILFCCLSLLGQAEASLDDLGKRIELFKISDIEIRGTRKVEVEAILEKIGSKKGSILDNYVLKKDLQKIYGMKYFESVEAHQEKRADQDILVFIVKEKPIVSKIIINGNDEVSNDDLLTQIKTKEFSILDINTIKNDVSALQKFYEDKGYYLAAINYETRPSANKESVELVFEIKEFDKVMVKNIIYLGNKAFSDEQLKDIMEIREEGLFSFMSGAGSFKEFNFQTDIERIKYFYKTKGYLQINVGAPEITVSEDKKWVFITIKVEEGPQFTVNDILFQGEVLFDESTIHEKISMKKGGVYSEEELRKDIQLLTEMYQDKGYAFANVLRTLHPIPGENKVDVEFSFEKGKIAYFGKIYVKGNTKTRDKVIRRELLIREGVKFSGSALRESKENVNRLGFFEKDSVIFNTVSPKGRDDVLDVEISVKERNTGQISVGAGYSTASKGFMQASISQNNFRGLGQNLSFSTSIAKDNKTFNVGLTEPYLLDTKWTAGGDVFLTRNSSKSSTMKTETTGADTRVGYPIFEYTRLFLTYKIENTKIQESTIDRSSDEGLASSVRTSLVYDKRNNRFEPSKGHYLNLSMEYAGLGGDKKWIESELDARHYYSVYGDLVFRSRLYSAKLNRVESQEVPMLKKYTLGGPKNLRGYGYEAIGPRVMVENRITGKLQELPIGGLFVVFGQWEFEHPLAREAGLKWVLFFDAGNVYDKYLGEHKKYAFIMDYGFGLRWFSPIGVLRFEYGIPIGGHDGGAGGQFHFDIGQLF